MTQPAHKTFQEVVVHTAKCEECNQYNKAIMYRCTDCGHQFCTPCWNQTGGLGTHSKANGEVQRPTILPYTKVITTKAVKKKKSQSVIGPTSREITLTRRKKDVISYVEEEDEEDDSYRIGEMRDETPAIGNAVRTKRSVNVWTGRLSSSSHMPLTRVDSAAVDQANDSPMDFTSGVVLQNTTRASTSTLPQYPDKTGIDTLLQAAASLESLASQSSAAHAPSTPRKRSLSAISIESLISQSPNSYPPSTPRLRSTNAISIESLASSSPASHPPSTPRMRSLNAMSIESLCSPSPNPPIPRDSRLTDSSSHANSSFARRAARMHSSRFIPEEEVDGPIYDYAGSPGVVPVSPPKMRKSRSGSLAGGRGYGADFATRMKARAEMQKGERQIDGSAGHEWERSRLKYANSLAKPTRDQRGEMTNFSSNKEAARDILAKHGEPRYGYSNENNTDYRLQEYQYRYPYPPTRPHQQYPKDDRV